MPLHALGDDVASGIFDEEVDVVRRDHADVKFRSGTVACCLTAVAYFTLPVAQCLTPA